MTDSRLQKLKRAWEASQSVEDEAAWLRARVQAGELGQDQQELLAHLGCAVPSCGIGRPTQPCSPHELAGWVHGLPHFDGANHYRWAVEIYWRVGTALARLIPEGEVSAAPTAARLMDQWITEPAESLAAELVALQDRVGRRIPRRGVLPRARRQHRLFAGLTCAMTPARWPDTPVNAMTSQATEFLAEELGESLVHEALRAELVPWALGYRDPVRERVETRQQEAAGE